VGGVLGNRKGECLSGTRLGSTQHPLYFLRRHSRASFCAVEMSAGVIRFARMSLFFNSTRIAGWCGGIPYH
jgi:hypothetical protein